MRILNRDRISRHDDDVEQKRLEKRGLALIRQDPAMTDGRLASLLAAEAGCASEDVWLAVCCAFGDWYRQKAPRATKASARKAAA